MLKVWWKEARAMCCTHLSSEHGGCASIVEQWTRSLSSIDFRFLNLMVFLTNFRTLLSFPREILGVATIKSGWDRELNGRPPLRQEMAYINRWLCLLGFPMHLVLLCGWWTMFLNHLLVIFGLSTSRIYWSIAKTRSNIWKTCNKCSRR